MIYHVTIEDKTRIVEIGPDGVTLDGTPIDVDFEKVDGVPIHSLLLDGRSYRLSARHVEREQWELQVGGQYVTAVVVEERMRAIRDMTDSRQVPSGPSPVVAPMPGMVMRVEVAEGDVVEAGQGIVIMEAMKMENELTAQAQGVVSRIYVAEGQAVEKDKVLVDLVAMDPVED